MRIKQFFFYLKTHSLTETLHRCFSELLHTITRPFYQYYYRWKIEVNDKMVLFMSKPSFSDNAYVLYQYMRSQKKYDKLTYVWLIDQDFQYKKDKNVIFVKAFSNYFSGCTREATKYIMSSKYLFFTHVSPAQFCPIKSEQIVINLWHGCGYKNAPIQGRSIYFDYALVPGPLFVRSKAKQWGCAKEKLLPIGYPRYDVFFTDQTDYIDYLSKLKGNNDKLIFWMPTFRNSGTGRFKEDSFSNGLNLPLIKTRKNIHELDQFCRKNYLKICIKRHQYQLKYTCEEDKFSNIEFIDNDDLRREKVDLYDLLKNTDALISDYSSVSVDYLLLDKPIAFTLDDFDQYEESRGFALENAIKYMPGDHLYVKSDLYQFLEDVRDGKDEFANERHEKIKIMHGVTCTNYSERILHELEKKGCYIGGYLDCENSNCL